MVDINRKANRNTHTSKIASSPGYTNHNQGHHNQAYTKERFTGAVQGGQGQATEDHNNIYNQPTYTSHTQPRNNTNANKYHGVSKAT